MARGYNEQGQMELKVISSGEDMEMDEKPATKR